VAEITVTTKWQAHALRGFVNTPGQQGREKIESKNAAGERTYRIAK
jgi:hypothetical protein